MIHCFVLNFIVYFYLFIYQYHCLIIIHDQLQIISVAECRLNDRKQSMPYWRILWHLMYALLCLLMSHLRDTLHNVKLLSKHDLHNYENIIQ